MATILKPQSSSTQNLSTLGKGKVSVCIVGGGNSAHVLIPFLSTAGHDVNLCTRRPNDWDDLITCDITDMDKKVIKRFEGILSKRSCDPGRVVPDADAIILCMPVHQYRNALAKIAPHINKSKKVRNFMKVEDMRINLKTDSNNLLPLGSLCWHSIRPRWIQLDGK